MNSTASLNAFLDSPDFPRYDLFTPDLAGPEIDRLMAEAQATLEAVTRTDTPATWDDVVAPLTTATERLSRAWSAVHHLGAVVDSPEWRDCINQRLEAVTRFWLSLAQNQALYAKMKSAAQDSSVTQNAARQKALDNSLRDFKLGGAELPEAQRAAFTDLSARLAQASQKFSEQLLDSTNASTVHIPEADAHRLAGLPDHAIAAARAAAEAKKLDGYVFTLQAPSLMSVLQFCEDRELRAELHRLHGSRASEIANEGPQHDNTPVMAEIVSLRQQEAAMLGYTTAAEMLLESKMARSPDEVAAFLREIAAKARPSAHHDLEALRAFAHEQLGLDTLEPWDIGFASEKLRQAKYSYSEDELRQYFPLSAVLSGLFGLIERLFTVEIRQVTPADGEPSPVWHPDVQLFEVHREGLVTGRFFLDLYARNTKRGGAWMDDSRGHRREPGLGISQTPVALMNCNFSAPQNGVEPTLTHDDVLTLFHEFGHGLHHLLTRVDTLEVAGISGVEWDAVELPSQFMENFAWEWETLQGMTRHAKTGEPLPRDLFDKITAAKNFQSGLAALRQMEFSLYDLRIHHELAGTPLEQMPAEMARILAEVRAEIAVISPAAYNRFPQSFSHIFAGGYATGYYSYKWAEVLSADAYAAFEEAGAAGRATTGQRFLDEILSRGGSRPAIDSFKAFRGREPVVEPLLRHTGLLPETAAA